MTWHLKHKNIILYRSLFVGGNGGGRCPAFFFLNRFTRMPDRYWRAHEHETDQHSSIYTPEAVSGAELEWGDVCPDDAAGDSQPISIESLQGDKSVW